MASPNKKSGKRTNLYLDQHVQDAAAQLASDREISVSQVVSQLVLEEHSQAQGRFERRSLLIAVQELLANANIKADDSRNAHAVDLVLPVEHAGIQVETRPHWGPSKQVLLQMIAYSAAKFNLEIIFIVLPDDVDDQVVKDFQHLTSDSMTVSVRVVRGKSLIQDLKGER